MSVPLGRLCKWLSGGTPKVGEPTYWNGTIPWISGASMHESRLRDSDRRLTPEGLTAGSREAPAGSTLILVRGMSLLREVRIGHAMRPLAFNQDVKALVPNENVDADFLTYALLARSNEIHSLVHLAGHGTGVLATDRLQELPIALPPLDVQRGIAGVLGSLDDLIDTNRLIIEALDRFLVVTWGLASVSDESVPLGDVAVAAKGVSYKGEFLSESGLPLLNLANFNRDGTFKSDGTKYYTGPVKPSQTLQAGDLVVANTDLTQKREILAWPILCPYEVAASTHHTFQVRATRASEDAIWLYGLLRQPGVQRELVGSATGTTVAALPLDVLQALGVPWPEDARRTRWCQAAASLIDAAQTLGAEVERLTTVRDALLPLLLSGRVVPGEVAA